MLKMTIVQLGVLLLVICLTTQVVSQNSTSTTGSRATTNSNTTMSTGTYASSGNTTKPTGAGFSLHAGALSVLTPVIVAASLLQRYC